MEAATTAKIPMTFRLPQERVAALKGQAKESGQTMTEIVDAALRSALTTSEQGSKDEPTIAGHPNDGVHAATNQGPTQAPQDQISLVTVLSEATGQPRSLCRLFISSGRVEIDGEVVQDPFISASSRGQVSLDGEVVRTS